MKKVLISSQSFLLFSAVALLLFGDAEGVNCYVCASDISGANNSCASVSSTQIQSDDNYQSCHITVTDSGDGSNATVVRDFSYQSTKTTPKCEGSTSDTTATGYGDSTCYCSGDGCNSISIEVPSYTCYSCDSAPMIDSGCADGVDWNPSHPYMKKETGCYACGKTKKFDGSVSRWCEQSMYAPNECTTTLTAIGSKQRASFTTTCYCRGDHCNSSNPLPKSTGIYLTLLLTLLISIYV